MSHPDAPFPDRAPRRTSAKKSMPLWLETILLLGIALVLAVVIKSFFVQAFYIPSPSMEPQLVKNDRILVEKWSYWRGSPQRGDIVVFKDPGGWLSADEDETATNTVTKALSAVGLYPSGGHLVKRVVGIGGDTVACKGTNSPLTVDGHALDEQAYVKRGAQACSSYGPFKVTVPKGYLWVMGDNREDSADSRAHLKEPGGGFVSTKLVVGKVFALVWPLGRAQLIHRPSDFARVPAQH